MVKHEVIFFIRLLVTYNIVLISGGYASVEITNFVLNVMVMVLLYVCVKRFKWTPPKHRLVSEKALEVLYSLFNYALVSLLKVVKMIFTLTKITPKGHGGCLKCKEGDSRCGKFWGKSLHHVADYFKTAAKVFKRLLELCLFCS